MADTVTCIGAACAEAGSWADWFSGAASAAAVIIALGGYWFAEWQRRRDRRERDVDTAQIIGMKVFAALNSTYDIHRHVWAKPSGPPLTFGHEPQIWRSIHPLVGVPLKPGLELDATETGLLIRLREAGFLVDLTLAISSYHSIAAAMHEYKAKYEAIHEITPPPVDMNGPVGRHVLTPEQYMKLRPHALVLEQLILSIRQMTQENVAKCDALAHRFHPMMKRHFPQDKFITVAPPQSPAAIGG